MTRARRHIDKLWLMGLLLLLLTACSSNSNDEEQEFDDLVLKFYVYTPERPMVTRAADDVSPLAVENEIHSLQIWAFATGTNNLVGYLEEFLASYINL